jgi:hypothetical protein
VSALHRMAAQIRQTQLLLFVRSGSRYAGRGGRTQAVARTVPCLAAVVDTGLMTLDEPMPDSGPRVLGFGKHPQAAAAAQSLMRQAGYRATAFALSWSTAEP